MTEGRSELPVELLPDELSHDLAALREVTAANLGPLSRSVAAARSRGARDARFASPLRRHPVLAGGFAGLALVVALLVIPVSYVRTTGQHVTLTLRGARDAAQVRALAGEFKSALHAGPVFVHAEDTAGGTSYSLEASVPERNGRLVAALARAFADGLGARGLTATTAATPIVSHASGSVYAFARDRVIQISMDGKSDAQLEAEIRRRLAEAGLPGARVSVSNQPAGSNVTFDVDRPAPRADEATEPGSVRLQMTRDGKPVAADGFSVQEKLVKTAGRTTLHIEGQDFGRTFVVDVPDAGSKSDEALVALVTAQLRQQGFRLDVSANHGRVVIQKPR